MDLYAYCMNDPVNGVDPSGLELIVVGYVYTFKGTINGQPVSYTGSARDVMRRLTKAHKWQEILNAKSTQIQITEVEADINIGASRRRSEASAYREALASPEQEEMDLLKNNEKLNKNTSCI